MIFPQALRGNLFPVLAAAHVPVMVVPRAALNIVWLPRFSFNPSVFAAEKLIESGAIND
jgi:hypothetical protein